MAFAARVFDATSHPGMVAGPGAVTVLINGVAAARLGDQHTCALAPPAGPHPPSPVSTGSATVFIAGQAAARVGDMTGCGATIIVGSPNVWIG
ncbi:PAAR domain-containing protein [Variovorax sp. YR752]|uniref:PAAR domain-containing protein n=1 Tax=Variovorax sp. YR752 TaxID=1884383 RepID=UPI0031380F03